MKENRSAVDVVGYSLAERILNHSEVASLCRSLDAVTGESQIRRRGSLMAVRNLFATVPDVRALVRMPRFRAVVESVLGVECFAVRGILFDKNAGANWKVAWHQDLSIAVREWKDVEGFGPWSEKAGVSHVQPPVNILEKMITLRVHLDDCGEDNGPLRVIPGSHLGGRLDESAIEEWRRSRPEELCLARAGDAVVMRPLILHASSAATCPARRRVVHLEFAVGDLPGGLEWHGRW